MVRTVMKDIFFLNQKSEPATKADGQVVQDLLDTLKANEAGCVGMFNMPMINPVITEKSGAYQTEEGCLSLEGVRSTTRYREIEVEYFDASWQRQKQHFSGWIAQIIQHECDHLDGIVI
jgi:peptide deformylase